MTIDATQTFFCAHCKASFPLQWREGHEESHAKHGPFDAPEIKPAAFLGLGEPTLENPLPRTPDGSINNCALASSHPEAECQMCSGQCPDRARPDAPYILGLAPELPSLRPIDPPEDIGGGVVRVGEIDDGSGASVYMPAMAYNSEPEAARPETHCMRDPSVTGRCAGPGKCDCECNRCMCPLCGVNPCKCARCDSCGEILPHSDVCASTAPPPESPPTEPELPRESTEPPSPPADYILTEVPACTCEAAPFPHHHPPPRSEIIASAGPIVGAPVEPPPDYAVFLDRKTLTTQIAGFEPGELSPHLFPFQSDIVRWALRRGRGAVFADTGLGKSHVELEFAMRVVEHVNLENLKRTDAHVAAHGLSDGPLPAVLPTRVLILAPLAVAKQTVRLAEKYHYPAVYARTPAEAGDAPVVVTNYDRLHLFTEIAWTGVVLDESSILKSMDGKTRTALIEAFAATPYKLACTATPAPNDHTELGNHAEFLGVMTRAEMLAMFFVHDGGSVQDWKIKGHARSAFWQWVASWAVAVRKPSDVDASYDDAAFTLPPLRIHHHVVPADPDVAKQGGSLFVEPAKGLTEQRQARRSSIKGRVEIAAKFANEFPLEPCLVWCGLNDEADAVEKLIQGGEQVAGSDDPADKERRLFGFCDGQPRALISKVKIAGYGMNYQHCARVVFLGVSHSFEDFYQAIRRSWRFGQTHPVDVLVITSELEGEVVANLERKQIEATELAEEMVSYVRDQMRKELGRAPVREEKPYETGRAVGSDWTLHLGDCAEVVRTIETGSIDYTIFSPPFASLYTYSDSMRDFGNCKTHDEFYEHFRFLVPELLRVTKPGRLLSFHCMLLPTSKTRDGYIGLTDFRGILIKAFQTAGWIFHSEVVIWKDPVTAMQRTKALGLLHKQIKKDSCMSRQGIPDYLVTMRAPGVNPDPVSHTDESFPVDKWQRYASPVWMDINPNETLQKASARENEDERHICPLQLQVIQRAIDLWTNPGDLVLSPFAGIGSEGYVALQEGRKFVGVELKKSYWKQACLNLESMSKGTKKQLSLLEMT